MNIVHFTSGFIPLLPQIKKKKLTKIVLFKYLYFQKKKKKLFSSFHSREKEREKKMSVHLFSALDNLRVSYPVYLFLEKYILDNLSVSILIHKFLTPEN